MASEWPVMKTVFTVSRMQLYLLKPTEQIAEIETERVRNWMRLQIGKAILCRKMREDCDKAFAF